MSYNTIEGLEYSPPPMFGDQDSAEDYRRKVDAAREKQSVKWAVAPLCTVTTPLGVLHEGDPIEPKHCYGRRSILRELAQRGVVIELTDEELVRRVEWTEATHLVNLPGGALITVNRGSVVHGGPIRAKDFARPAEEAYDRVNPNSGRVTHVEAKPEDDGTRTFNSLIEKGFIIANPSYSPRPSPPQRRPPAPPRKKGPNE